jgi:hypothetical protein
VPALQPQSLAPTSQPLQRAVYRMCWMLWTVALWQVSMRWSRGQVGEGSGSCNGWAASTSGSTARASFFHPDPCGGDMGGSVRLHA